ncbi:unnamed protein product [Macrosiphum euphorbiae]|uniref:Uncharacterized protein n=1 Tax=Macrosiphum euphorbiae TaxID=13131 RepID=A0AAV0XPV4_9HEMI|nr:unnamed protein product [Macrosiphum euphorbiae]
MAITPVQIAVSRALGCETALGLQLAATKVSGCGSILELQVDVSRELDCGPVLELQVATYFLILSVASPIILLIITTNIIPNKRANTPTTDQNLFLFLI